MARKEGCNISRMIMRQHITKRWRTCMSGSLRTCSNIRKKVIYALKEITAGDQFEIEIYPQFRSMDEVPPEGRTIKKDNNKAQKNLNDKNARKYVERLINENFSDRDIWMTLTYDDEHLHWTGMWMQQSRMCKSISDASTIRGKREVSRMRNMSM